MNAKTLFPPSFVAACLLMAGLFGMGCQPTGGGGGGDNTNDNDSRPPSTAQKQDLWTTNTKSSSVQDFASSPLPAGFFDFDGRSCDAFAGATSFVGTAISQNTTGAADTIVTRDGDPIALSDPVGATGTVVVRITSLNLRGATPVQVLCDGQPTEWNVHATLSGVASPEGTLTATKTHDNGGTAETILPVLLKLTFTNVEKPTVQHVLDFAESGLDPVEFHAQMTWVHKVDPNAPDSQAGFIVGVAGGVEAAKLIANGKAGPRLQGGQTLIACSEHGNPGGSHLHNTCIVDSDGDGIPDGVDICRYLSDPDQEDRDGDRFGDLCDPCPDDPTCPQSGDECETVCRDINDELLAANAALAPVLCEMISTCLCLPPSCDPLSFVMPERCAQLTSELTTSTTDSLCLYTRFTGWGCDRCVLPTPPPPSCPDPCETTTCPQGQKCLQFLGCFPDFDFDLCAIANCPAGQGCDPKNGQCCEDPNGGCPLPTFDLCGFVTCPVGSQCNPATGQCWNPETGECFEQEINADPCKFVTCPAGSQCNPATGQCLSLSDLCADVTCASGEFCNPLTGTCASLGFDICGFVTCPTGETCNPSTGSCE